jgi:hypothetical protein
MGRRSNPWPPKYETGANHYRAGCYTCTPNTHTHTHYLPAFISPNTPPHRLTARTQLLRGSGTHQQPDGPDRVERPTVPEFDRAAPASLRHGDPNFYGYVTKLCPENNENTDVRSTGQGDARPSRPLVLSLLICCVLWQRYRVNRSYALILVLSRNLPGGTEENQPFLVTTLNLEQH